MYTVSKGPSKIVAQTRRGLSQNYEKLENIKAGKRPSESGSTDEYNVPRPVFQSSKRATVHLKQAQVEEESLSPQHEEIVKYINESWNMVVAQNPYDSPSIPNGKPVSSTVVDSTTPTCSPPSSPVSLPSSPPLSPSPTSSSAYYCVEPPSPVLSDFKPFDLESWWGRRLFNNITKSL